MLSILTTVSFKFSDFYNKYLSDFKSKLFTVQVTQQLADVGAAIGKFIDFMVSNKFIDLSKLSVIGHSLGKVITHQLYFEF